MNKIGHYLQEHLEGEVVVASDARRYFATDASIFTVVPSLVVYPKGEGDVRKVARFTWQLAERGRIMPITARGAGTDLSGAAIGSGTILAFPAHMNRILELDAKTGYLTVEPGINFGKLQQTLHTYGRFLPPYPASMEYSTVGGAVANNAAGEKSAKYGTMRSYVQSLRVVLANGEVIITERLSRRELSKKLGLSTFEGEVYRTLDALLEEHKETIRQMDRQVSKNVAGYDLLDIKRKDGSFDLTPLIVGSQGTLGIVTEINLETERYNPETSLVVASFDNMQDVQSALAALAKEKSSPSTLELVDGNLLRMVAEINPAQLKGAVQAPFPAFMLLIEYDDARGHDKRAKKTAKLLDAYATQIQVVADYIEQERLWKARRATAAIFAHANGGAKALPLIEDGIVPQDKLEAFVSGIYDIFAKNHLSPAVWGHAQDAHLHVQPYLDLSQLGDRQKAFRMMDEYYKLVISLGGSISAQHGDGRLRAPYLPMMYGQEIYELFQQVKKIFDPYGTLNPGVKVGVTVEDIKPLLRNEYSLNHLYEHLPRS